MRERTAPGTLRHRAAALAAVVLASALLLAWASPARALEPGGVRFGTWVGEIHADAGGGYEYAGSACPVEDEVCIEILATYRIVALTPEAHVALETAVGTRTALTGFLVPGYGRGALGTLVVWEVAEP